MNEIVKMIKSEEVGLFLSKIIHAQTEIMFLGSNKHLMMQTLEDGDRPHLPPGLSVMNIYTEMTTGSKHIVVVVKNLNCCSNHHH